MNKKQKRNLIILTLLMGIVLPSAVNAQYFRGSRWWKEYRNELTFAIGTSQVLTDLGGRDQVGSDFIYDMELNKTRYAISGGYRYYIQEKMSVNLGFSYAMLQGDDALTQETFRNNRNLNFKTPIAELSCVYEYHITNAGTGHRYKLKGARGKKSFAFGTYVFAGIGGFYFDPRALDTGVRLRPLHTEGQGLDPIQIYTINGWESLEPPKQYKPLSFSFPVGAGIRYGFDAQLSVGLKFGWRFTTTDYIDDVSTVYWDKNALEAAYGSNSAYYSDRSLSYEEAVNAGGERGGWTAPGQQRGDATDRDNYGFLQVTVEYKLNKKKKYGRSKRIKSRKSMPSF